MGRECAREQLAQMGSDGAGRDVGKGVSRAGDGLGRGEGSRGRRGEALRSDGASFSPVHGAPGAWGRVCPEESCITQSAGNHYDRAAGSQLGVACRAGLSPGGPRPGNRLSTVKRPWRDGGWGGI